jgi:cyclopropane-fatty-acyl-phospholipid synthase
MNAIGTLVEGRLAGLPRVLSLEWPGGRAGSVAPEVLLKLRSRELLVPLARGRIGELADAYVRGELDIDGELPDVMAVAGALAGDPLRRAGADTPRWLAALRSHWRHRRASDARQVQFHYDLSDEFYALWLDPRRVYSCAYFASPDMTLAQAQEAKLDLVCRKLQLGPGQRFLDIGAGWGGLLLWAARHYGVRASGITLSRDQHAYVSRLIDDAGLKGQVDIRLLDYRDLVGAEEFDRIASIGMFEHVGRSQADRYFATLHRLLRPGGLMLNHAISAGGIDNDQLGAGMGDFIEKHIFPGGELVHVAQAALGIARAGLELVDLESLRPHYARTLWDWSANLERRLDAARALTSERTVRAYRLYLAGSAMGFERGWLSVHQLLATRPRPSVAGASSAWSARSDHPFLRAHMLA